MAQNQQKSPSRGRGLECISRALARYRDCCGVFSTRCSHGDATVLYALDTVVRARSRCGLWVSWESNDVRTRENVEAHSVVAADVHATFADCFDRRSDAGRDISVVVERVLVHGVENGFDVGPALSVACITELLRRVDGDDNDCCENRDDTDNEEELDEREASLESGEGHGEEGTEGA